MLNMAAPAARKAIAGSIHRIREFELEKVCLAEEFDILQIVGEGWFGKILLVEHRGTDTEMVLKALPKPYIALRDFYREFHYGLHLGAHKNIITTYDVAFETAGFYVFSQEYAPLGDLSSNVSDTGIGELHTKRVAKQLAAALDHLHARDLVHRDVKLDNILVFKSDFSRIKLCDFGETRKSQTDIRRRNEWLPYSPPEVLQTRVEETYKANTSHDVWQFGIVIFVCLTGCLPWQKAAFDDPRYVRYLNWYNTSNPLRKQPKLFKLVSSRAQRLFKKFLEPRKEKRPAGLADLQKYMDDRWMAKGINEKNGTAGSEVDELCPSMYSFHSDIDEKNKLLRVLLEQGIETTVDRVAKKARIRDWIQNSVIAEEDETENEDSYSNNHFPSEEEENLRHGLHPVEKNHQRWSSLRYTNEKHINPRTGEVLEKSSNYNPLSVSYDMQQIQPLAHIDANSRYNAAKDESPSQGSMKDSAYGSIDFKATANNGVTSDQVTTFASSNDQQVPPNTPYPSQQLQKHLQQHTTLNNAQVLPTNRLQKPVGNGIFSNGSLLISKNTFSKSAEIRNSTMKLQQNSISTSTTTLSKSPAPIQPPVRRLKDHSQSRAAANNSFMPMKDSPYDVTNGAPTAPNNTTPTKAKVDTPENLSDSSVNVVQGKMRINPYASLPSSVSKIKKAMNPQMVQLGSMSNGDHPLKKSDFLDPAEKESLMQIKKMLIESKTGVTE